MVVVDSSAAMWRWLVMVWGEMGMVSSGGSVVWLFFVIVEVN